MQKHFKYLFFICASTVLNAQQWKSIVKEDFGTQNVQHQRSQTPANDLLPGITSYNPLTDNTPANFGFSDGNYMVGSSSMAPRNNTTQSASYISGVEDYTIDAGGLYGNLFAINANPAKQGEINGSYYKYETSVFDIPGANYRISFYGANLLKFLTPGKEGYIGLAVRHTGTTPTPIASTGSWTLPKTTNSLNNTLPWEQKTLNFSLPLDYTGNSLTFNFYNTDTDASTSGNDLVLDDILIEMQVITVSGKVFIDENANGIQDAIDINYDGIATPLYAYVINTNNKVISKAQVASNGTYTFATNTGVPYSSGNINLKIVFSSSNISESNILSSTAIVNKIIVSENVSNSNHPTYVNGGTIDGSLFLLRSDTDLTNLNIGVRPLCYEPSNNIGTVLETKQGITSLSRAGISNGNWPMVRKGGHLALESKTKPFVLNRLNMTQINNIPLANLVDGMMVFDTTNKCLKIYVSDIVTAANSGWKCFTEQTCPE